VGHVTLGIRSGHTSLHALGEGSQRSVSGRFVGISSDRHGRRPKGNPCGRPIQASGPRLFLVVMSRQTPFSVGPTYPDIT